ncbi:MAG: hypothetical protein JXR45_23245 [Deltaproteobacteria bacterium]|nr:hypothetical protein [Deltaproteobacteria bacterium]
MHRILCVIFMIGIPAKVAAWDPDTTCPKPPKDSTQTQIVAGDMFASAEQNYQENKPLDALKEFLCSHRIIQHENTLFNIAQISKLDENREKSIEILKDFVSHTQGNHIISPIQEIIDDLEEKSAAAGVSEPSDTDTEEESSAAVEDQPPKPKPAETAPQNEPTVSTNTDSTKRLRITGVVLMAVGGGALVTGSIFQGLASRAQGNAEETDNYSVFQKEQDDMQKYQTIALVGFIIGGVMAGTGMVLFLMSQKKEVAEPSNVVFVPTLQGVAVTGRF